MDYKKILKSRKLRMAILDLLSFIPDKPMIQLQYRIKTGRKLNLKNPKRYTEKLQWYKLYYRDPLMAQCVDKYEVRKYVKSLGLGHILNECYGVFDKPEDIDFDKLPDQFVLKDTLGGGGNSVIICKDKSKADLNAYVRQMNEWVHTKPIRSGGREWPYYSGKHKHRIIVEKYISSAANSGGLIDYKFFEFDGVPAYLYVIADRVVGESGGLGIYDADFHRKKVVRADERPLERAIIKPENYEMLKEISSKLSEKFPHARVDLYDADGEIIFGEITFFDGSGYMKFEPDTFDYKLGQLFDVKKLAKSGGGYTLLISREEIENKYVNEKHSADLPDYKFYCFNGKCFTYYIRSEYMIDHKGKLAFFDRNHNQFMGVTLDYCNGTNEQIDPPPKINELVKIAEILADSFPHVRVDLYFVQDKIVFGEMTFFNASGYFKFEPDEFDQTMGAIFRLPMKET